MVATPQHFQDRTAQQVHALKALVKQAAPTGPDPLWHGDLGSHQEVADYGASEANMWRYTHMYGAKHVTGWLLARARLGWADEADRPLVVLGAGPLLCATGWTLFDRAPRAVHAFDVLDWGPVLDSASGRQLRSSLGRVRLHAGVFCPMGARRLPRQLQHLTGIRALRAQDIPQGATVLMPMMLNHLLEGGRLPADTRTALHATFAVLEQRQCRIVIADLAASHTTHLWRDLAAITGAPGVPAMLDFASEVRVFAGLYSEAHQGYRTFQRCPQGARLRMLAWDGRQWTGV